MNTIKSVLPKNETHQEMRVVEGRDTIVSQFSAYLQDESKLSAGEIQYLAFAETEKQVADFLKDMSGKNIPVTISNGRTGVTGGCVPKSGAVLTVEKMDKILGTRKVQDEIWVRCQAGVVLETLHKESQKIDGGYFYPVDATEMSARIGGTVSTNASGERSFRYGSTRKWVRSLRVVLTNGEVLEIERGKIFADNKNQFEIEFLDGGASVVTLPTYKMPEVKNASGYYAKPGMDIIDLFIGSEGTLGVITEIEVALAKRPENIMSVISFFPEEKDALNFFFSARKELDTALVFEYFDSGGLNILREKKKHEGANSFVPDFDSAAKAAILLELEYTDETLEQITGTLDKLLTENKSSIDNSWAAIEEKDMLKIRAMRHALPEGINETITRNKRAYPSLHKISADIAVPENKLLSLIDYYKSKLEPSAFQWTLFGHIGESHLHTNILPKNDGEFKKAKELHLEFAKKSVELGGTISAEHGVGKIKHPYLEVMFGRDGLKQMAGVKKALDTACILNRGNIFPEELL
ncbi:MAG: FAD-binding oxidoreductase [Elusimicrobia bacterium]|nr:FAD-binding oxidoreductase [Elusimicrobiota bacterium]